MSRWQLLTRADSTANAEALREHLQKRGIKSLAHGDNLAGFIGEVDESQLNTQSGTQIWVQESDLLHARVVLNEWKDKNRVLNPEAFGPEPRQIAGFGKMFFLLSGALCLVAVLYACVVAILQH